MAVRALNARGQLTEAGWQAQVIGIARVGGWCVYHPPDNRPGGRTGRPQRTIPEATGWPDLVLVRDGELLVRELKTDRGRLGPGQQDWLDRLAACGVDVAVWRPRDRADVEARLLAPRNTTTTRSAD
ncbi:MAG: VRR-NUC domain-containing protein [Solirubrobacteraceae bacterium]|nr:VRR-NUC domain-containing protein [Solirubrobacteraceae bacterium]